MAEDLSDKTEAPTQRRREEAREQGQIARSADLTAAAMLLGFLLLMTSFGPGLIKALKSVMLELLSSKSLSSLFSTACTLLHPPQPSNMRAPVQSVPCTHPVASHPSSLLFSTCHMELSSAQLKQ